MSLSAAVFRFDSPVCRVSPRTRSKRVPAYSSKHNKTKINSNNKQLFRLVFTQNVNWHSERPSTRRQNIWQRAQRIVVTRAFPFKLGSDTEPGLCYRETGGVSHTVTVFDVVARRVFRNPPEHGVRLFPTSEREVFSGRPQCCTAGPCSFGYVASPRADLSTRFTRNRPRRRTPTANAAYFPFPQHEHERFVYIMTSTTTSSCDLYGYF